MAVYMSPEEALDIKRKTAKPMLWVGIVSMIMLFAGLTSAYIVRQAEGNWLYFDIPQPFYTSTIIIVISSLTIILAKWAIKRDNQMLSNSALLVTLLLGLVFAYSQFQGWVELVEMGVFFAGREANAAGSFLYVLTGLHMAHLGGGILALIFTSIKGLLGKYSAENHIGIDVAATYWHFLDILWIYLLLFLVFIR
ncbi:MAG: cytochrome oxidase subunit III [Flavobacteriales bacterium]|jgi:cytochrome c oxidase subunit 3|nr:cytochrome oxidase subunit III [Flavobacteriales bacterium]MBT3964355.1 cytochrome oxidase subunit III [Flavobacteriales bacterium]MBT4705139.1 cytochrome oxidase subunit III [Flavobacteriales bacterium]MBT4930159.1 cytochrome oxidase subunit III [Flavobacteriales bacterium]MBT5133117.1 cytochrome oxidase subunit III [Flavobacteriales bacterium]